MRKLLFASLITFAAGHLAGATWPAVMSSQASYRLVSPISKARTYLVIRLLDGTPAYRLTCGSHDTTIDKFNFSGDFECQLQTIPADYKRFSTLLTEDMKQSKDWESRASFSAPEVEPPCDRIPDFGALRTFRLRGMRLTLELSHITFKNERQFLRLQSFYFKARVEADPAATRPIAQPPVIDPKWKELPCTISQTVRVHFSH